MRTLEAFLCAAVLVSCTSCGTVTSRGQGTVFGAYPLMAVWADLAFIERGTGGQTEDMSGSSVNQVLFLLGGLVCLPFDLAIDVVALPIDLGAWAFGKHKGRRASKDG
ncbi:MAG: hypothetical protein H6838_15200 [Planctomycetes bacterium]|nr:hypothetical protein [Planctomycetota bacterium]